jgi:hypothetical protein
MPVAIHTPIPKLRHGLIDRSMNAFEELQRASTGPFLGNGIYSVSTRAAEAQFASSAATENAVRGVPVANSESWYVAGNLRSIQTCGWNSALRSASGESLASRADPQYSTSDRFPDRLRLPAPTRGPQGRSSYRS